MKSENSLFSFFVNIKDKITSLFSSIGYSSKEDINKLIPAINNKFHKSTEETNYLLNKRSQKNRRYFNNNKLGKKYSQSFTLGDSDTSIGLSEIYSEEELDFYENKPNLMKEYGYYLNSNNYINIENYFENNHPNNLRFIGQKYSRNFFDENSNYFNYLNDSKQENSDIFSCIYKYEFLDSELKRCKKRNKSSNKNKITKAKMEKNDKDIKRISNEFFIYKAKLNLKNKINNHFLNRLYYNDKINIKDINNKKEKNKKIIRPPFDNLCFTHPERFSFYSTQKKIKLEKSESKYKNKSNLFSISTENNINIIQNSNKLNNENNNEFKYSDKNIGNINVSSIDSGDNSKIFSISSDFTFGENYENQSDDNTNLNKLLNENINNSSFLNQNINATSRNDNLNDLCSIDNNNSKSQDYFMDIDENNLIKNSNRKQCNQSNEKISSIFPITTKNNPFINKLSYSFENKEQNKNNNENNINQNILSNNEFFKSKNLFNINENNNKKGLSNLNFSFGKA